MKPETKRSARRLWFLLLLILAFPAAYVLSIGPAVFIFWTFGLDKGTYANSIAALYAPLERIPDGTAMKRVLHFYVRLWDPRE